MPRVLCSKLSISQSLNLSLSLSLSLSITHTHTHTDKVLLFYATGIGFADISARITELRDTVNGFLTLSVIRIVDNIAFDPRFRDILTPVRHYCYTATVCF